jgi:diadenosine tetraphosphate (Ap4A) HIT family hydrolase
VTNVERSWPSDWDARMRGDGCVMCDDDRSDENSNGIRFFTGLWSDAYLGRSGPARGYAYVIWRGRHVAEPTELSDVEAFGYWGEVLHVARAIEQFYAPCKMNYQLLGNAVPHLHTHVIPRYVDDAAPGRPLPSELWEDGQRQPFREPQLRADVQALRELVDAPGRPGASS